jgi:hypothetical protein
MNIRSKSLLPVDVVGSNVTEIEKEQSEKHWLHGAMWSWGSAHLF